jgi:hypothetical protein
MKFNPQRQPIDGDMSMFIRHQALLAVTLTLPALLCTAGAGAQDRAIQDKRPPQTTGSAVSSGVPQAPVGHRQPRASDIPADAQRTAPDEERSQLDRVLDKQLWICRGC